MKVSTTIGSTQSPTVCDETEAYDLCYVLNSHVLLDLLKSSHQQSFVNGPICDNRIPQIYIIIIMYDTVQ